MDTLLDTVHHADIFDLCAAMPSNSVDMILCDLPYGTTACSWDTVIPFAPMWAAFKRVIKPRGAIVLTASQPFTSALVMSNPKWFRYEWIVNKRKASSFLDAARKPLKVHESVLIFGELPPDYYPQMVKGSNHHRGPKNNQTDVYGDFEKRPVYQSDEYFPKSIIEFSFADTTETLHPTQKPVDLFAYLIRTYTQPGELVFDPCVGSGTTAYAARAEGRNYIVGDSSAEYVEVTRKRLVVPYTPSFMPALEKLT